MGTLKLLAIFATLTLTSLAYAEDNRNLLFDCQDSRNKYKLAVISELSEDENEHVYLMKVLGPSDNLIYTSSARKSSIGGRLIFSASGEALTSDGHQSPAQLYFTVEKLQANQFRYRLIEISFAPPQLPDRRLNLTCE